MGRRVIKKGRRGGPDRVSDVRDLGNAALFCHAWGRHRWRKYIPMAGEFGIPRTGVLETQICDCKCKRYAHYSRATGLILDKWRYVHADNYLMEKDVPVDGTDYRREYFKRERKVGV